MKISIKISILLMVCRSSLGDILAQNTLEVCNNLPRHGDRLVKQQIAYEKPGSGGENIIWDFRDIIPVDEYCLIIVNQSFFSFFLSFMDVC